MRTSKIIIGRAEKIDLPQYGLSNVPAKTDTGADLCAIWASDIHLDGDRLSFVFFGPKSEHYTGKPVLVSPNHFSITRVANSFGVKELRYKVKLRIVLKDRRMRATFTLSDRSKKTYPVLLGRRLLKGKFLVDVKEGEPLSAQEKQKQQNLQRDLSKLQHNPRTKV